jgi:phosphoserine phosphatase
METTKKKLHIFDVCGTLFHSNTTFDFLSYYFKKKNKVKYIICRLALSYPSKALIILFSKLGVQLELRLFLVRLLKSESRDEIGMHTIPFVRDYLSKRKNNHVHQILNQALYRNERIILVSASLDLVIKAIADYLQVKEYYASLLELKSKDLLSGNLIRDIKGDKLSYIQQKINLKEFDVIVVTDNYDDISLIQVAEKVFVVSKKRGLDKWERLLTNHIDAEIIKV